MSGARRIVGEEQRLLDEVAVTGHYRDRLMEEGMASL